MPGQCLAEPIPTKGNSRPVTVQLDRPGWGIWSLEEVRLWQADLGKGYEAAKRIVKISE